MTTKNPFPGMNPYFAERWRDAHTSVITYIRDALQERLPADLFIAAEEETVFIGGGKPTHYRPDVQVREPWSLKEPAVAEGATKSLSIPAAADPIRVLVNEEVERWLKIQDKTGRLITALELLRPSNKL